MTAQHAADLLAEKQSAREAADREVQRRSLRDQADHDEQCRVAQQAKVAAAAEEMDHDHLKTSMQSDASG